jgi:toxin secretion/phage lysis holin
MKATDTLWATMAGGTGMTLTYLFGGIDKQFQAVAILIAIDFITGWAAGYKGDGVDSKKAYLGIKKKAVMICFIIIGHWADVVSGTDGTFRTLMIWYLIGIEITSIAENAGKLGLAIPTQIKQKFTQLQEKEPENKPKE